MTESFEDLLHFCTRILKGPEERVGVGFLIAPGIIASAGHIISRTTSEEDHNDAAFFVEADNGGWLRAQLLLRHPECDFCLLKCDGLQSDERFLTLATSDAGIKLGDKLVGYTRRLKHEYLVMGDDLAVEVIGFSRHPRHLNVLSQPRIVPGMSGSPVVEPRSRTVIGVIIQGFRDEDIGRVLTCDEIWEHSHNLRTSFIALYAESRDIALTSDAHLLRSKLARLSNRESGFAYTSKGRVAMKHKLASRREQEIYLMLFFCSIIPAAICVAVVASPVWRIATTAWPMFRADGQVIGQDIGLGAALLAIAAYVSLDLIIRLLAATVLLAGAVMVSAAVAGSLSPLLMRWTKLYSDQVRCSYIGGAQKTGIRWQMNGETIHIEAIPVKRQAVRYVARCAALLNRKKDDQ